MRSLFSTPWLTPNSIESLMSFADRPLLIKVLASPDCINSLNLSEWDLLVRQARAAGVLARLGFLLQGKQLLDDKVPDRPASHFRSAMIYADGFAESMRHEIRMIRNTLQGNGIPLVLLKGAAYYQAQNDAAKGRIFSDIDILVQKERLSDAEGALLKAGWYYEKKDRYDRDYYKKWMHELPPMRHMKRGTYLDVHHNILPLTSKDCPDAEKLLRNIVKSNDGVWVLSPEVRIIHSAVHLFFGGEFDNGLRDLSDLDLLLREFAEDEDFWARLWRRAGELRQLQCLHYALRYTRRIFATPVPEQYHCMEGRGLGLSRLKTGIMDFLFERALQPNHPSCADHWSSLCRWLLYIRSHWLRMPLHLLIPHLIRKSWMRLTGRV